MTPPFRAPQPIAAPAPLHIHYLPGRSSKLVVSLSGVGGGKGRKPVPPMEFVATASAEGENHVLFVSDATRSWMNAPGLAENLAEVIEQTRSQHGITGVLAMGNSMGGFMALVLADLIKIDQVAAFAPQFSMNPRILPEETRWSNATAHIANWRYPDVGRLEAPGTIYYVFHGADLPEARHWLRFPRPKNLHHFIFGGIGHGIAARLRATGLLSPILSAVQNNRSRVLRRTLQRSKLARKSQILRREAFEEANPELIRAYLGALNREAAASNSPLPNTV